MPSHEARVLTKIEFSEFFREMKDDTHFDAFAACEPLRRFPGSCAHYKQWVVEFFSKLALQRASFAKRVTGYPNPSG